MNVSVMLIDPQYPANVGNALRACALLGASVLYWSGDKVSDPEKWPVGTRLPREERMRCYKRTRMSYLANDLQVAAALTPQDRLTVPVCVEIVPGAEDLRTFAHPHNAVYVFGPENGHIPKWVRAETYRFVRIPVAIPAHDPDSRTPYNLSASVSIVLYDRLVKLTGEQLA